VLFRSTELAVTGTPRPLDPRTELTLYRAAQEGLTNVRKHAHASRVDMDLAYDDPAAVSLAVRDNGVGHLAGRQDANGPSGFGLLGLSERARQLGGSLVAENRSGGGYCLTVRLPSLVPVAAAGGEIAP